MASSQWIIFKHLYKCINSGNSSAVRERQVFDLCVQKHSNKKILLYLLHLKDLFFYFRNAQDQTFQRTRFPEV